MRRRGSDMRKVLVIAEQTSRERMRRQGLTISLFYLTVVPLLVLLATYVTVGEERVLSVHLGLAGLTAAGLMVAIPGGIALLRGEQERQLLVMLLVRPVRRSEVVVGKFLGLALSLFFLCGIMGGGWLLLVSGVAGWRGGTFDGASLWLAALAAYAELLLVSALALFLSLRTRPLIAAALTLFLLLVGRSSRELLAWADSASHWEVRALFRGLYLLLPNFARLNWVEEAAYGLPIPWGAFSAALLYALLYLMLLVGGACLMESWGGERGEHG
jgi:Cu-processing system permease protein